MHREHIKGKNEDENDEEYISKIVETIQANDLQNKLANMKNTAKLETKQEIDSKIEGAT